MSEKVNDEPEEIVLTKADRLPNNDLNDENDIVNDDVDEEPEIVFRKIIITPASFIPPILPHLIHHMTMAKNNEQMKEQVNSEQINEKKNEQVNNEQTKKDVNPELKSHHHEHHKPVYNVTAKITEPKEQVKQNNVSSTNDILFKYYGLMVCLVVLLACSSIVIVKITQMKQKYINVFKDSGKSF